MHLDDVICSSLNNQSYLLDHLLNKIRKEESHQVLCPTLQNYTVIIMGSSTFWLALEEQQTWLCWCCLLRDWLTLYSPLHAPAGHITKPKFSGFVHHHEQTMRWFRACPAIEKIQIWAIWHKPNSQTRLGLSLSPLLDLIFWNLPCLWLVFSQELPMQKPCQWNSQQIHCNQSEAFDNACAQTITVCTVKATNELNSINVQWCKWTMSRTIPKTV